MKLTLREPNQMSSTTVTQATGVPLIAERAGASSPRTTRTRRAAAARATAAA